jgi:hypothetical protein
MFGGSLKKGSILHRVPNDANNRIKMLLNVRVLWFHQSP